MQRGPRSPCGECGRCLVVERCSGVARDDPELRLRREPLLAGEFDGDVPAVPANSVPGVVLDLHVGSLFVVPHHVRGGVGVLLHDAQHRAGVRVAAGDGHALRQLSADVDRLPVVAGAVLLNELEEDRPGLGAARLLVEAGRAVDAELEARTERAELGAVCCGDLVLARFLRLRRHLLGLAVRGGGERGRNHRSALGGRRGVGENRDCHADADEQRDDCQSTGDEPAELARVRNAAGVAEALGLLEPTTEHESLLKRLVESAKE